MNKAKPMLTPKQAAELLGVPVGYLNKISRPGDMQIKPVKMGYRTKRYQLDELESYIEKMKL